jgi:fructose-bisphosphate aldolase, class I
MDSRTGKNIRLGRLRHPRSGRYLIVAYSHGVLMGPGPGMSSLAEMRAFATSIHGVEGLMVTSGMLPALEDAFVGRDRPSLVIHLDWQNFSRSVLPYQQGVSAQLATVERVVAAGADAVMTYLFLGHDDPREEREEVARNAHIVNECARLGLPVMIEPRSAREASHPQDKQDVDIMAMYCRVSAEIGADLVKCIYPGTTGKLARIVESCTAPVLVAGGARKESTDEAMDVASSAIEAGAQGLVFGRNIYQAASPQKVIDSLAKIVHGAGVAS